MLDDPEKRLERRVVGVHRANAKEVEMDGAGKMSGRKCLRGPQVHQQKLPPAVELARKLRRCHQKRSHVRNYILALRARGNCGGTARKNLRVIRRRWCP